MYLKRVRRRLFTLLGNKYKTARCIYNHCPAGAKRQFQRLKLFRPHVLEQELGTWCFFGKSVPKTVLAHEKSLVLCAVEGSRCSAVGCWDVMEGPLQQGLLPGLPAPACLWGRALPKPCAGSHWKGWCLKYNLINYVCSPQRRKLGFWDSQDSCGRQRGGMLNTSGIMTDSDCEVWLCNVWHLGLETASQNSVWKQIRVSAHVCKEQREILLPKPKTDGKGRKHDYVNNFKFSCLILTFLSIFEHTWLTPAFSRHGPSRKEILQHLQFVLLSNCGWMHTDGSVGWRAVFPLSFDCFPVPFL